MLSFISLLKQSDCKNKISTLAWFVHKRFGGNPGELRLRVAIESRSGVLPICDLPSLYAALTHFSKMNPWNQWSDRNAPMHIVDLGANVGITTLWFALRYPAARLLAVEMMPENALMLEQLKSLNNLDLVIANVAAGHRSGTVRVRRNTEHSRHSLAEIDDGQARDWGFNGEYSELPARRLAEIMDSAGWPRADLAKIDIEGAEELLLRDIGSWGWRVGSVFMEIHHNVPLDEALLTLAEAGFAEERVLNEGRIEIWATRSERKI
jgi:FkbM family methyltransferase